jgi:hypothetical protein
MLHYSHGNLVVATRKSPSVQGVSTVTLLTGVPMNAVFTDGGRLTLIALSTS